MPAMTGLGFAATARIRRLWKALTRLATRHLARLDRAMRNRQAMRVLARMDDRMLADIGLTRADLRDAFAQSPWCDPSNLLRARALERRLARLGITYGFEAKRSAAPPLVPEVDDLALTQTQEMFRNNK